VSRTVVPVSRSLRSWSRGWRDSVGRDQGGFVEEEHVGAVDDAEGHSRRRRCPPSSCGRCAGRRGEVEQLDQLIGAALRLVASIPERRPCRTRFSRPVASMSAPRAARRIRCAGALPPDERQHPDRRPPPHRIGAEQGGEDAQRGRLSGPWGQEAVDLADGDREVHTTERLHAPSFGGNALRRPVTRTAPSEPPGVVARGRRDPGTAAGGPPAVTPPVPW